jgi:hypothetical protein
VLVLAGAPARATVVQRIAFDDQAVAADRIFVGTVREIEVRPSARAPRYFETIVTFAVDEVVAGAAPTTVSVRLSGGTIGHERQSIDGMPEFAVGEHYVVMLDADHDPPLVSPFIGFNQGLYRVVADRDGRTLVRDRRGRPLDASTLQAIGRTAQTAAAGAEPELASFVTRIRSVRAR